MTYELVYSETSKKQLLLLEKEIISRILSKLEQIRIQPLRYVKKLVGIPYFRLRVGKHRVILAIRGEQIFVVEVGHRKNIYKNLP